MAAHRWTRRGIGSLALLAMALAVALAVSARPEASAQTKPTFTLSSAQQAAGITEGQQIVFTVTADQPVSEDYVIFAVAESGGNFIGADGTRGRRSVMKQGKDTIEFVHTVHDNDLDEVDGYVRMRLVWRDWYTIDEGRYVRVEVRDNDPAPTAINAALERKVIERSKTA